MMTRAIIALVLVALASGCARGGAGTATAPGAIATGGSATTNVQINGSLALGDKVAEEAAKVAQEALKATPIGAVTDAVKSAAVDKGVAAGVEQAKKEGKQPTESEVKELRSRLEEGVNRAVAESKGK